MQHVLITDLHVKSVPKFLAETIARERNFSTSEWSSKFRKKKG